MQIPIRELKKHLKNNVNDCKHTHSFENSIIAKSFFALFNKMINKFSSMTEYETGLFIQSFDKWLDRKDIINHTENDVKIEVGDICMIDWNINYNPELSYVHPCLIVEDINNMIFVAPVSGQQDKIDIAYHPEDNPNGDKNYRKVKVCDGFLKESVLFISEMKVISKSRVINKIGSLTCNLLDEDGLFREIRWHMISCYFPYEYSMLKNTIEEKQNRINALDKTRRLQQSRADKYRKENIRLNEENKELKDLVDKCAKSAYTINEDSK